MSVDKGIFRLRRRNQPETFDFHSGEPVPARWKSDEQIDRYVPTHCCYCGVQCGMYLKVADGKVVGVEPREDFPLNHGMLCPKGTTVYQTVNHPDRLTYPLMRRHGKESPLERASWDEVLDTIAQRFHGLQSEYGKDSVAVYSGSSMTNCVSAPGEPSRIIGASLTRRSLSRTASSGLVPRQIIPVHRASVKSVLAFPLARLVSIPSRT